MAKVALNVSTPYGYIVARAVNLLTKVNEELGRAQGVVAMIAAGPTGNNTTDAASPIGAAMFGAPTGSDADLKSALQTLQTNLAAFITANQGALSTLDNGDVN